jgi:hypothetical protein
MNCVKFWKKKLHWQTCYFLDFWHFKQIVSKKFSNEKNWNLRIIIIIIIIIIKNIYYRTWKGITGFQSTKQVTKVKPNINKCDSSTSKSYGVFNGWCTHGYYSSAPLKKWVPSCVL